MQKLRKFTQNRKFTKLANQKNLDNFFESELAWSLGKTGKFLPIRCSQRQNYIFLYCIVAEIYMSMSELVRLYQSQLESWAKNWHDYVRGISDFDITWEAEIWY